MGLKYMKNLNLRKYIRCVACSAFTLSWVLLLLLAVVLFLAEIKVPSHGALTIGGVVSLLLGSLMLFRGRPDGMGLSLGVVIPAILFTAGFFIFAVGMALRAQRRPVSTGSEGMIGLIGTVLQDLDPEGKILVHGEVWSGVATVRVARGEKVRVVAVEGLLLRVAPHGF